MKMSFPEGVRFDVTAYRFRCALCQREFERGSTVTIGEDLTIWIHKRCWEEWHEKTMASIRNLQLRMFSASGLSSDRNAGDQTR